MPSSDASQPEDASTEPRKPTLLPELLGHVLSFLAYRPLPETEKDSILSFCCASRQFSAIGRPFLWKQIRLINRSSSPQTDDVDPVRKLFDEGEKAGTLHLVRDLVLGTWQRWDPVLVYFVRRVIPNVRSLTVGYLQSAKFLDGVWGLVLGQAGELRRLDLSSANEIRWLPPGFRLPKKLNHFNVGLRVDDKAMAGILEAIDAAEELVSWETAHTFKPSWDLGSFPAAASKLVEITAEKQHLRILGEICGDSLPRLTTGFDEDDDEDTGPVWPILKRLRRLEVLYAHAGGTRDFFSSDMVDGILEMPRGMRLELFSTRFDLNPAEFGGVREIVGASPFSELLITYGKEGQWGSWELELEFWKTVPKVELCDLD